MASCTIPVHNNSASGDSLYGPYCSQAYINYFWNAYGFAGNKEYWDDGFGWEDPCNSDLPLARAFNACYLLTYSAPDYLNDNYSSSMLNWGRRFVREHSDDLRSKCGDGTAIATAFSGWFVNDRIELYLGFFYSESVPERVETLIHEARHKDGRSHNAKFPAGSVYGAGKDGADSSWGYEGAWMYGALYLWWFYAAGTRTTSAMKQLARQRANVVIDNAFATHPGYTV